MGEVTEMIAEANLAAMSNNLRLDTLYMGQDDIDALRAEMMDNGMLVVVDPSKDPGDFLEYNGIAIRLDDRFGIGKSARVGMNVEPLSWQQ